MCKIAHMLHVAPVCGRFFWCFLKNYLLYCLQGSSHSQNTSQMLNQNTFCGLTQCMSLYLMDRLICKTEFKALKKAHLCCLRGLISTKWWPLPPTLRWREVAPRASEGDEASVSRSTRWARRSRGVKHELAAHKRLNMSSSGPHQEDDVCVIFCQLLRSGVVTANHLPPSPWLPPLLQQPSTPHHHTLPSYYLPSYRSCIMGWIAMSVWFRELV